MSKTIVFFAVALVVSVSSFRSTQYETNLENSIHWAAAPYHVLQSAAQVPRSVDVVVKFRNKFQVVPQVGIAVQLLDWQAGQTGGFSASVQAITEEQFTLRYTAVTERQLYAVFVQWFAVYDPRVLIQYFETTELGPLMTGEGTRDFELNIKIVGKAFTENPVASPFLVGVKYTRGNWLTFLQLKSITPTVATINVKTWHLANIPMIRICLIIGTKDAFWSQNEQGFRVPDGNHPWLNRAASESAVDSGVDVPKEWQSGERQGIVGFSGIDADCTINGRFYAQQFALGTARTNIKLGTWGDSKVYQIAYSLLVYRRDPDIKVFDANCAELFSECNYQGDSITVCDRIQSLPVQGWAKPIKSFTVPDQRSLKLYNQENLKGSVITYNVNTDCVEALKFSFVQLSD